MTKSTTLTCPDCGALFNADHPTITRIILDVHANRAHRNNPDPHAADTAAVADTAEQPRRVGTRRVQWS